MRFPRNLSYNFVSYSFLFESNSCFRSKIVSHSSKVAQVDSKTVEWRLLEPWYRTCMAFFVQLLSSSLLTAFAAFEISIVLQRHHASKLKFSNLDAQ